MYSQYTMHPKTTVVLRPYQSAKSPATSAPKNVPADKIETIRVFSLVGKTKAAVSASEALTPGIDKPVYKEMK